MNILLTIVALLFMSFDPKLYDCLKIPLTIHSDIITSDRYNVVYLSKMENVEDRKVCPIKYGWGKYTDPQYIMELYALKNPKFICVILIPENYASHIACQFALSMKKRKIAYKTDNDINDINVIKCTPNLARDVLYKIIADVLKAPLLGDYLDEDYEYLSTRIVS